MRPAVVLLKTGGETHGNDLKTHGEHHARTGRHSAGGRSSARRGLSGNRGAEAAGSCFRHRSGRFAVSQGEYNLVTGKAYQLDIISTGKREYAIRGDDFFNFIWLRKIEVADVEIKATGLYEIEMEREGKARIIFVPIRPGKYRLYAKGLDAKGAVSNIIVK
jgi:hypothetical protein